MKFKQPLTACVVAAMGIAISAGAWAQSDSSADDSMSSDQMSSQDSMAQPQAPQDKRFYVAPMVSYGFLDNDNIGDSNDRFGRLHIENDDSVGGTLAIGKPLTSWLNLEFYGFYFNPNQNLNGNNANSADVYGFGLDALFFPARDTLPVYGLLGASYGKNDVGYDSINNQDVGDDADADFLDAGVGIMYPINDYGLAVRAEYRYRYMTTDIGSDVLGSGYEDARYNQNIVSLGLQIPLGAPPQAPKAAPAPIPAPAQPVDSDGDGVIDANDQCPGTPRGTEVDARGCPVEKKAPIVLKGVTFKFDKSSLTQQATSRLDNVIEALQASNGVTFRIDGYTDSIGTDKYNTQLSQRRVDSVQKYLLDHGISSSRITGTTGHGEANPVATNDTAAGRAQNRRVELNVTSQGNGSSSSGESGMSSDTGMSSGDSMSSEDSSDSNF